MRLKLLAGAGLVAAMLVAAAAPALAHVTTDPSSAPQGGEITLGFRVPNEQTTANVVKVDIAFPTDRPLLGVDTEPLPGWTSVVTNSKLNPPVQTDDGPVTQAVSEIAWTATTGGGTAPGQFQEFFILVQQLPSDSAQVVFKAIQTYSDGSIVRWIDPVTAGQPDPEHPTPILTLTPTNDSTGAGTATPPGTAIPPGTPTTTAGGSPAPPVAAPSADVSQLATKKSVSTANTFGLIGIVIGAIGLIIAVLAIRRRPDTTGNGPPHDPHGTAAGP